MSIFDQLQQEAEQQKQQLQAVSEKGATEPQQSSPTRKVTQEITRARDTSRDIASENPRGNARALPSRDEIQEFSFHLRDALKVKVQAEVPHEWQDELEDMARQLDVKKLELYRFIIGEFLGKVERKTSSG